jgi:hypothetical protein
VSEATLSTAFRAKGPLGRGRLIGIVAPPGADFSAFTASSPVLAKSIGTTYTQVADADSELFSAQVANELEAQINPASNANPPILRGWALALTDYHITPSKAD